MMQPLFSIIMPVYNVEKYLVQSIESILSQTFKDYELIVIDDGSTDSSPIICDKFRNNSKVTVVHKTNGGLSSARNCGIQMATGQYMIFIDSDDYWDDDNALQKLSEIIQTKNPDIITWRYKKFFENSQCSLKNMGYDYHFSGSYNPKELLASGNYSISAWKKAIRTQLIIDNALLFEDKVFSEDILWSAKLLTITNNIVPSNLNFCVYRIRKGSISHSIGEKNISDLKKHLDALKKLCEQEKSKPGDLLNLYLAQEFTNFIVTLSAYDNYEAELSWVKDNKYILKNGFSNRTKILNLMIRILGIKFSIKVIKRLREL